MPTTATSIPIVEQITLDLIAKLQTITTAAGYGVTLDVQRAKRTGNVPVVDRVTVVIKEGNPSDDDQASQNERWINQPYSLNFTTFEPEDSDYPARKALQIAVAWTKKILRVDKNRSGLAINTTIGLESWIDDGVAHGALDEIVLPIEVLFMHDFDDPFQYTPL